MVAKRNCAEQNAEKRGPRCAGHIDHGVESCTLRLKWVKMGQEGVGGDVSVGSVRSFLCFFAIWPLGPCRVDTVCEARAYPVSISAAPCRFVFCFDSPLSRALLGLFLFSFFLIRSRPPVACRCADMKIRTVYSAPP